MLSVLIATDHKPFRESLARLVLAQPFFRLVAVCADTHAAIAVTAAELPSIVLIDGSSDPLAAIEATKKMISCSNVSVIVISRNADAAFAGHAMAAGALGYLTKQCSAAEIIIAIQSVAADNAYLCNDLLADSQLLPTPSHLTADQVSSIKRSGFDRRSVPEQPVARTIHWHNILQFAN